jgi:autotransporter-associated beta strand protein
MHHFLSLTDRLSDSVAVFRRRVRSPFLSAAAAFAILAPAASAASTNTWVGGTGNNFSTLANWTYSSGTGPAASGDTLLFSGAGSLAPNNDLSGATYSGIGFSGAALYTLGGNAFTLAGGSISNAASVNQTVNNSITLGAGGGTINTMVASANCAITLGGVISGSGNLSKGGGSGSVLTLSGLNTFSGALNFNAGTVNFTTPPSPSGGNLGNPSAINFGGNSTTTLMPSAGAGSVTISYPTLTINGTSTGMFKNGAAAGTTFEISAKITGTGNCKQNSPTTAGAVVRFSNDSNDFTGTFGMAAGIVEFTSLGALGAGSGAMVIGNGASAATLRYVGSANSSGTRALDWQGTSGSLTLDSTGAGYVRYLASGNLKSGAGASTLTLSGSSTGANTLGQVVADSGGALAVTKSGTGTWVLSGANTYSGTTTVSGGTLQLGAGGTLGSSSGALALSGGSLDLGGASITKGPVTLSSAGGLRNGTLTGSGFSATLASGVIAVTATLAGGAAPVSLSGAGTLALFGANTYGGGTTIGGSGTLLVSADAGLGGAGGGLSFTASGILAATNNGAGVSTPVTIGSARTVTVNGGVSANFFTPDTNDLVIAAKITGAGNVIKKSSSYALGNVRFSNDASDYTGDFTAGYGNTEFSSIADQGSPSSLGAGAAASLGQINLNNGGSFGTLRYVGAADSATRRPLNWTGTASYALDASGAGAVQFLATDSLRSGVGGAATLVLRGTNTGLNTLAQTVADLNGATALTKNDAGTWVLSANNSYSGPTTISGGTLVVDGALTGSGPVSVQSGAFLGGGGSVSGVVTVNSGGTLAPGAGANGSATLTLAESPSLGGVVALNLRKSGATLTSDRLSLGVNTLALSGTLAVNAIGDALAAGDSFQLFDAAGYTGSFSEVTLPELGTGLTWDATGLSVDGTLRVITAGSAPTVVIIPVGTNVECGGAVTLSTISTGTPAPGFQWYDNNGAPVLNATGATLTLTNLHSARAGVWTVVASNGLGMATNSTLLTISDTTPPTITCPSDVAVVTTDPVGANVSFTVTASDDCDAAPSVVSAPASGSFFAAGTNTVVATATDSSGNSNTCSFRIVVDRAPVVQTNVVVSVAQDQVLTLDVSNLLAVVTDPDGDGLSVAEVSATSTNGGAVTLTSTNLTYQPVPGFSGEDLFAYVVTDGRGGLATNAVTMHVLATNEYVLTVSSSINPAGYLDAVAFTAGGFPTNATGLVRFLTNGVLFASAGLTDGSAEGPALASLPRGTNVITAEYAGDELHLGATNSFEQVVTNHPPLAGPASYTLTSGATYKILIADLATNWTDLDGDSITLLSVNPSTNGSAVSLGEKYVYYSNANPAADQFTYVISDGYEGSATGVVSLASSGIDTNRTSNITGLIANGDGTVTLHFAGIPGYTYWVEAATNASAPSWIVLSTNVAGTNGLWNFTDPDAASHPQRFYRTHKP